MKKVSILFCLLISVMAFGQVSLDPCISNYNFHIVILGSSTAAGTGPSHQDSTWVNKYRAALQQINPQIQVTNLAQGGYTTYKLMPNNFSAPANRPSVDTIKNITAALKLKPDAIIINLPSNDRQWPMTEQLANFDSLYKHSINNEVPFFVCTTQPIISPSSAAYQRSVRDSIMAQYGPFAIDLFLPLADTNNTVLSHYAADAVHLNDSGHAVIFNQIWNADVLSKSYKPRTLPDLSISGALLNSDFCADSSRMIGWLVYNFGDTVSPGLVGYVKTTGASSDSTILSLSKTILPCTLDTIWTVVNAGIGGSYTFQANITLPADTFYSNNQWSVDQGLVTPTRFIALDDTLCKNASTQFNQLLLNGDTVLWYTSLFDSIPVPTGNNFTLINDTSLFAQGVTGRLTFLNSLSTIEEANINFQGNMFNLLPTKDVTLEKLEVRLSGNGPTPIKVFTKSGTYRGFENNPAAWNLYYHDTVTINLSEEFVLLDLLDSTFLTNDTVGLYVQVASGVNRVMYKSANHPSIYTSKGLTFLSGSGIAGAFGTTYENRTLNLKLHYSFGFNPLGMCATPRLEVGRVIDTSSLDLGPDLLISVQGRLLNTSTNFTNHIWINLTTGDTLSNQTSLLVDTTLFQMGSNQIIIACIAQSAQGCPLSDTIICILDNIGLDEQSLNSLRVYPNPTIGILHLEYVNTPELIQLFSISGKEILKNVPEGSFAILDLKHLPEGMYILVVSDGDESVRQKVIKY